MGFKVHKRQLWMFAIAKPLLSCKASCGEIVLVGKLKIGGQLR